MRALSGRPELERRSPVARRRRRTGRNVQVNIKVTAETAERFAALADKRDVAFGELLKQLLDTAGGMARRRGRSSGSASSGRQSTSGE